MPRRRELDPETISLQLHPVAMARFKAEVAARGTTPAALAREKIEGYDLLCAKLIRSDEVLITEYGSGVQSDWENMSDAERDEYLEKARRRML